MTLLSDQPVDVGPDARQERSVRTQCLLERAAGEPQDSRRDELLNEVVVLNREIAIGIAHRFNRAGIEIEDLEQVALLGLTKAAHRYSCGRGPSFTSYAFPTITGEIKRYFRDCTWSVRPPRGLQETVLTVRGAQADLVQRLGHRPSHLEVAEATGLAPEQVDKALVAAEGFSALSLDAPTPSLEDVTVAETIADPDDEFDRVDTLTALHTSLETLPARDQLILRLRFDKNLTQEQIGAELGVSQMQVSRLLTRVFARLREHMQGCAPGAGSLHPADG